MDVLITASHDTAFLSIKNYTYTFNNVFFQNQIFEEQNKEKYGQPNQRQS